MDVADRIINKPNRWFGMVPAWIFEYANQIGPEGIAIYACLCCYANKERRCYPSQEILQKDTGCSKQTVRRRVNQLLELSLVRIIEKGNGRGKATLYEIVDFLQRVPQGNPLEIKGTTGEDKGYLGGTKRVPQGHPNIPNNISIQQKSENSIFGEITDDQIERNRLALDKLRNQVKGLS